MAYTKTIFASCWCKKRATKEVYTRRNELDGQYCTAHANQRVRKLEASEKMNDAAIRQNPALRDKLL